MEWHGTRARGRDNLVLASGRRKEVLKGGARNHSGHGQYDVDTGRGKEETSKKIATTALVVVMGI